jgi:NAD(P)H dehydrogenase (quinone)
MSSKSTILVTGAAGNIGGVGRNIVEILCRQNLPVRALVHRLDQRSDALRSLGAEVIAGDMTKGSDMARALDGCRRIYFGMSVSQPYLQATITAAAAAKEIADCEIFVNISQMTVSQMSLHEFTDSPQQQQHWLAEQALNWSGLPVTHVRATVFLEHPFFSAWAAASIAQTGSLRLPFGNAHTSPISAYDVARVIASILADPTGHKGKVYELTGPVSQDLNGMAKEYAEALGRDVVYDNVPFQQWQDQVVKTNDLPDHVLHHFLTMAKLHADNRYDRLTNDVASITGKPAMSVRDYVASHTDLFAKCFATQPSHA